MDRNKINNIKFDLNLHLTNSQIQFLSFYILQQLEMLMKAQGLNSGMKNDIDKLTALIQPSAFTLNATTTQQQQQQQFHGSPIHQQEVPPVIVTATDTIQNMSHMSLLDEIMDDSSPVGGDPMFSSQPVSPSDMDDCVDM